MGLGLDYKYRIVLSQKMANNKSVKIHFHQIKFKYILILLFLSFYEFKKNEIIETNYL